MPSQTPRTVKLLQRLKIVPRWFIFLLDLGCTLLSVFIAILIENKLDLWVLNGKQVFNILVITTIINTLVFSSVKTYKGIVRYTGLQDAMRVLLTISISSITLFLIQFFNSSRLNGFAITETEVIIYAVFSFLLLLGYRVSVKQGFELLRNYKRVRKSVVIYGAGETGTATKRVLSHDTRTGFNILAFVDDDRRKNSKSLDGVPIIGFDQLKTLHETVGIDELIIASFSLSIKRKNEVVDFCLDHEIGVLSVPPYSQWAGGSFTTKQLKTIKIEELLERDQIEIHNEQIRKNVKGKRILVTGAAGSIGSEIVRQLITYAPEMIILCDQAETPLHDLDLEIKEMNTNVQCVPYLASVNHLPRMDALFAKFKPHHVYHAAAYKHVPMMEFNPVEAVKVNVLGTKLIADLSIKYEVARFVMVSTDKAVNPTNVMGASKRLAEMYVQALSSTSRYYTKFITTRFGNVLGSNGSVILRFKEQIEKGGPVTVTHPNITRYFMTIPEACQLVLEAGSMGNGGEVFVFDMGSPVKIADLAKKMIRLYGLVPNIDVAITYSGLRPGEKLYEELLTDGENTVKTYHEKIMIAKVREVEMDAINSDLNLLSKDVEDSIDESQLVSRMKSIVPEYISNNSIYEYLDTAKVMDIRSGGGNFLN
ncbi:MAG: polysaccharide biosynthesis protein [Chitinophagia bacterium]|nr:polysaccharide biosynthesis protein [Chitinophagia bacterium]